MFDHQQADLSNSPDSSSNRCCDSWGIGRPRGTARDAAAGQPATCGHAGTFSWDAGSQTLTVDGIAITVGDQVLLGGGGRSANRVHSRARCPPACAADPRGRFSRGDASSRAHIASTNRWTPIAAGWVMSGVPWHEEIGVMTESAVQVAGLRKTYGTKVAVDEVSSAGR